jgi:hypothetical protein
MSEHERCMNPECDRPAGMLDTKPLTTYVLHVARLL